MDNHLTLDYYNRHAERFTADTGTVNFMEMQNKFLNKLPEHPFILDFGCGSGRDTKYFLEHGCRVTAIDGSEELCRIAGEFTGIRVKHMYFQDLSDLELYDGIWACASILHVSSDEMASVLEKMRAALKPEGILYVSYKYGTFEGERNGRYFTDMTEERFEKLLDTVEGLTLEEQFITSDVRPGRGEEKWLNLILRKN
jgi:SAM-dependent methyltransferase